MTLLNGGRYGRAFILACSILTATSAFAQESVVNVYSYRQP